jgi:hypothetical protein
MNDPRRLNDEGTPLERSLLRDARDRRAPAQSRERALLALGLAGAATSASIAGSSGAVAALKGSRLLAIVKWLGIGAVAGVTTLVGVRALRENRRAPVKAVEAAQDPAAPVPSNAPGALAQPDPTPVTALPPSDVGQSAPVAKIARPKPVASASRTSSIGPEIAIIDVARTALSQRRPESALAALDRYEAEFPRGGLALEASYLRIEALLALGDRDGANRLATRVLAAHPESVYAKRIRELFGSGTSSALDRN